MIGAILAFLGRYWLVEAESAATSVAVAVSLPGLDFGHQVADLLTGFDGKLRKYLRNQASEISPGSPLSLAAKLNFSGL